MKIVSLIKPAVMIAAMMTVNAFAGNVPKLISFTVEDVSTPNKPLVDFVATYEGEIEDIRKMLVNFEVWPVRTYEHPDTKDTYIYSELGEGTNWVVRYRWEAYKVLPEDYHYDYIEVVFTGEYPYGGVQMWEDGPYWMEQNVGASKPADCGYYFQWDGTTGYKRENGTWMESCDLEKEFSDGPWRLPTAEEIVETADNSDAKWTELDQVKGFEMRGKGPYAERAIFFPAAGHGTTSALISVGTEAAVWSATEAKALYWLYDKGFPFGSLGPTKDLSRDVLLPVRAIRSWDSGRVESDRVRFSIDARFTKTTEVPVAYGWLNSNYWDMRDADDDAHEARAKETAANGINKVWECFVIGLNPNESNDKFLISLELVDGEVQLKWTPNLDTRLYTILGSTDLKTWEPITDETKGDYNFFKVKACLLK